MQRDVRHCPARRYLRLLLGALGLLALWLCVSARSAHAATHVHAIVIGSNRGFASGSADSSPELSPLRYADDDAAAFHELIAPIAQSIELLTVMDADTQLLYPKLVPKAQVPTRSAVGEAVRRVRRRIDEARGPGTRNVVFVFFSGHGALDQDGKTALALFDGGLNHDFLYQEILAKLPADELHLLIDACHAEAVVRPRDAQAEVVGVSADQANAFLVQSTLARFPHVGAILAATTNTTAHEWDAIRHGVFSHELLSALRGAADINHDRRIEYSEVYAFMAAANREVRDVRARLAIVVKPPDVDRRTALLTLSDFPRSKLAWLTGVPGEHGIIEVDDARGRRLATLHGDREFAADLLLPAEALLYVRGGAKEASFTARAGEVVNFRRLRFADTAVRSRGALERAVRAGLFAAPYGRRYYDGVVDQTTSLTSVKFAETDVIDLHRFWNDPPERNGFDIVLGGGLSRGVAGTLPVVHGLNVGSRPTTNAGPALSLAALWASDRPLTERHVTASAGWFWPLDTGSVRILAGGMAGAGVLSQLVDGLPARHSAAFSLSPVVGSGTELGGGFGFWSELELSTVLHRRDERWLVSFMPSAWLGASLRVE